MDSVLAISISLVFLTALAGIFVKRRKRDRVLADLQGFYVTLRLRDGDEIWGKAEIYPTGIEFVYTQPYVSRAGHLNSSYILFQQDFNQVSALYRYHDELSPTNQERRLLEISRADNPGLIRRNLRHLRNFLATFRDAINESFGIYLSRMKASTSSMVLRTQDEHLKKFGASALGVVASAFDPILERHIGNRVVVDLATGNDSKEEYCGVLKEYSAGWMSVLGCRLSEENRLPLGDAARLRMQRKLDFWMLLEATASGPDQSIRFRLRIKNAGSQGIRINFFEAEGYRFEVFELLSPGGAWEQVFTDLPPACVAGTPDRLPLELELVALERAERASEQTTGGEESGYPPLPNLVLVFDALREVDVYLPREIGTLRHRSAPAESATASP